MSTVALGYCHHDTFLDPGFHTSVVSMILQDRGRTIKEVISLPSGPIIYTARNIITNRFLRLGFDYLLMLDADMVFDPTIHEQLIRTSRRHNDAVVGGLCFAYNQVHGTFPTMYRFLDGSEDLLTRATDIPADGETVPVDATGGACLLIPRTALSSFVQWKHDPKVDELIFPAPTHQYDQDQLFCMEMRRRGVPVVVDTSVRPGHAKRYVASARDFEAQMGRL